ncbi:MULTISPECIES: DUF2624 family protein [unclassified Sporolactobacillus]|uniref:DUF2624 family protein n=1 Tax=unclassified Sporolactobacillus TaxID=2628533 RepID=UPI0023684175|nr:DUF2624 family protein [Sporolactobacillus sp. CQH2019]MDD9147570.1 DUF2624 family protein [Sporolactobacillus sp. CQH2019]
MIQQIVNQRINQVTAEELYRQAVQYGIPISKNQAARVAGRVHGKNINLFDPADQRKLRRILVEELGPKLAEDLNRRFEDLMIKYQ